MLPLQASNMSSEHPIPEPVQEAAKDVIKKAPKKDVKNVALILEQCKKLSITYTSDLSFQDYLEAEGILDTIGSILSIVNLYTSGETELELTLANKNIVILSSQLIYIGTKLGEVEGQISKLESTKKLTRARYLIEAKKESSNAGFKISNEEADSISRLLCEEKYYQIDLLIVVKGFLTNLMYNTRNFVEMLNKVCDRTLKELHA